MRGMQMKSKKTSLARGEMGRDGSLGGGLVEVLELLGGDLFGRSGLGSGGGGVGGDEGEGDGGGSAGLEEVGNPGSGGGSVGAGDGLDDEFVLLGGSGRRGPARWG